MKKRENSNRSRLDSICEFLKHSQNLLKASQADSQLLKDLGLLTAFLRSANDQVLAEVLSSKIKPLTYSATQAELADDIISNLSNDELASLIEREDLPRAQLEKIAILRFSIPKGGLSVLRTKKALTEKLLDILANEVGHEGIARLAATNPPPTEP